MIPIKITKTDRKSISDLEHLSESLTESIPTPNQTGDFPSIWTPGRTTLAYTYTGVAGSNKDNQLVEVHYIKEIDYDQFSRVQQTPFPNHEPLPEELETIKQAFEKIYSERLILRKSPIFINQPSDRFVTDTVTIGNNGLVKYKISGFNQQPYPLNFKCQERTERKTPYFGYDPTTSFLRNKELIISLPLLKRKPISIDKKTIEAVINTSLQSAVNQNQREIQSGLIDSVELTFFNKGNLRDLFYYFNKWMHYKV